MEEATADGEAQFIMKVTVKTLDSQNHDFKVADNMLVKDFKTEIAEKITIPADQQRLIFRGRVLHDDKKMSEYNLGDSIIHVVQRPANSAPRSNDEPPPPSQRMAEGIPGVFISAQTGPLLPNFGPRTSASTRLQISNRMLSRAFTHLRRMEEETVNLQVGENSSTENPLVVDGVASARESGMEAVGVDVVQMDIDSVEDNTNGLIPQVANAASIAALTSAGYIVPNVTVGSGNRTAHSTSSTARNLNAIGNVGPFITSASAVGEQGINPSTGTAAPSNARRQESPRLREMATVVQSILSFQDRLSPYLRFLEITLRSNQQYDNTEERESVQFVFNNMSSIMHYLSHSYHALSDMICDFSTPPETRRLRAATAILFESSTVVRASIPFAVPGHMHTHTTPSTPDNAATPPATSTPETNPTSRNATPTPSPRINGNQNQNFAAAFSQQLSQMFGAGLGPYGAQIQVDIDGITAGQGGQAINFQDLIAGAGIIPVAQNVMLPIQQPQSQSSTPVPVISTGGLTNTATPNSQGTANATTTGGAPASATPSINNNNLQVRGAFDVLLACNSHHSGRDPSASPRPANFKQYVKVEEQLVDNSNTTEDLLTNFIELLLQSDVLPLMQPIFRDVIVNYLMRGRDAQKKEHVRSCATKLAKNISPYLERFTNKISLRNMHIDYSETYSGIITEFLTEIFHLTVTLRCNERYQSVVVSTCETAIRSIMAVFAFSMKDCPGYLSEFTDYLMETVFGGSSLVFRENVRKTLLAYISSLTSSNIVSKPKIIDLKPAAGIVQQQPSTSSSTTRTSAPVSTSMSSPEVLPPKQAKQSSSPISSQASTVLPRVNLMEEEDLDDLLNLNSAPLPQRSTIPQRLPQVTGAAGGGSNGPMQQFENALRNIPSDWVDTVRHDLTRQFGMSEQPPFSPAYTALISRKK